MAIFSFEKSSSLLAEGGFGHIGKRTILNELEINGEKIDDQDDFNMDNDDRDQQGETDQNPADTAEDAASDEGQDQENAETTNDDQDQQPAEEDNAVNNNGDEEDNFTLEDQDEGNLDNTEADNNNTDEANQDQQPEENNAETTDNNGEATAEEDQGNNDDQDDNFNMDDPDAAPAEDNGGGDAAGNEAPPEGGENDGTAGEGNPPEDNNAGGDNGDVTASSDPSDNVSDEDAMQAEEQIYDSLTDDQKRIRTLQLKIDYKDLYETFNTTIDGINGIPRTMDNLDSLKRTTNYITKAKSVLIDYIQTNFDKNTYLENYTVYIKFMAIFRTVSRVIDEITKGMEAN